jgi:prepilin-type N-terminal cleavage/methylation domain-containing protein
VKRAAERGFTLVEILVAIVVLGIGLLVLAGGSVAVTQSLTGSGLASVASARAQGKLDELRSIAASTNPWCGSANFAGSAAPQTFGKLTLSWTINPSSGAERIVRVITSYSLPAGKTRTDTLRGIVGC